jgi:hypothetical protein
LVKKDVHTGLWNLVYEGIAYTSTCPGETNTETSNACAKSSHACPAETNTESSHACSA